MVITLADIRLQEMEMYGCISLRINTLFFNLWTVIPFNAPSSFLVGIKKQDKPRLPYKMYVLNRCRNYIKTVSSGIVRC